MGITARPLFSSLNVNASRRLENDFYILPPTNGDENVLNRRTLSEEELDGNSVPRSPYANEAKFGELVAWGLLSRNMTVHALTTKYDCTERLFHGLLRFERIMKSYGDVKSNKAKNAGAPRFKKNSDIESNKENLSAEKEAKKINTDGVKCFNCGKLGAFRADVPNQCPVSPHLFVWNDGALVLPSIV